MPGCRGKGRVAMGLDLVEFVMEVEERFGVRIPDADATALTTPRKLIDYLAARLDAAPLTGVSPSEAILGAVRRVFVDRLGVFPHAVAPDALLDALVPRENRRGLWTALRTDLTLT